MKPFDYINSINFTKKNIMVGTENDDLAEKAYVPYITNRTLSYFTDTLLYANEMNKYTGLDNKLQYEFLLNSIRKRKRFSQMVKSDKIKDIDSVKEYYGYSNDKAKEALKILRPEQIQKIKENLKTGGMKK